MKTKFFQKIKIFIMILKIKIIIVKMFPELIVIIVIVQILNNLIKSTLIFLNLDSIVK